VEKEHLRQENVQVKTQITSLEYAVAGLGNQVRVMGPGPSSQVQVPVVKPLTYWKSGPKGSTEGMEGCNYTHTPT